MQSDVLSPGIQESEKQVQPLTSWKPYFIRDHVIIITEIYTSTTWVESKKSNAGC